MIGRLLAATAFVIALGTPAHLPGIARATEPAETNAVGDLGLGDAASPEERKRAREAELEAIRRTIAVSEGRQESLRKEIDGLQKDQASLSADLVATGRRIRATEDDIARIEARLDGLHAEQDGVRQSLAARRDVMAEVLMALQRMGRTPPPALLSRPEDALGAIRGSILAGAVLPDLRVQAEALAADLRKLSTLSVEIEAERDALRTRFASLVDERARIDLLVEAKQAQGDQTTAALEAEREKAAGLADQAKNLQTLIASLESEVAAAAQAAAEAQEAARNTERADHQEAARRLADTNRIAPAVHFADAKGLLPFPVSGTKILGFGDPDGFGGETQGVSLATRPGTSVLAPADGWVVYAGPFRSYGQVLILNAGDGYHIVLAGMERIDATLGQFVLGGEPIAVMGSTRLASIGDIEHTSAQPILYVEFRKDGNSIDSAPWWAPTEAEVNG
jgi:septal ring factor EnvC (AmiA/AmiB activator)